MGQRHGENMASFPLVSQKPRSYRLLVHLLHLYTSSVVTLALQLWRLLPPSRAWLDLSIRFMGRAVTELSAGRLTIAGSSHIDRVVFAKEQRPIPGRRLLVNLPLTLARLLAGLAGIGMSHRAPLASRWSCLLRRRATGRSRHHKSYSLTYRRAAFSHSIALRP